MKWYLKGVLEGFGIGFIVGIIMLFIPLFWIGLPLLPLLVFMWPFIKKHIEANKAK